MTAQYFTYRAFAQNGAIDSGEIAADTEDAAHEALIRKGLKPFSIKARRQPQTKLTSLSPLLLSDLLADTAALVESGVPLKVAFDIVREATPDKHVAAFARQASENLASGASLTSALGGSRGANGFLSGLLHAGQTSGDLAHALRLGADVLSRDAKIKEDLFGALSYPAFILISFLAALLVILGVVAPALAPLLGEIDPAKGGFLIVLVLASKLFAVLAWPLIIALFTCLLFIGGLILTGQFSKVFDRLIALGPTRDLASKLEFGAWAIGMGGLLSSGATAIAAADGAGVFMRNQYFRRDVRQLVARIRDGATLANALAHLKRVPTDIRRMAEIGERSGSLGPMLERAGQRCQTRAIRQIRRFGEVAAPIALLTLGALMGGLVAGLLTSISAIGDGALS